MAIRFKSGNKYTVQVQLQGVRKTRRGTGTEAEARKVEALLLAEMEKEAKLDEAHRLVGVTREQVAAQRIPTLREFFEERWVPHAEVTQNASTRRISKCPWNYALYYMGDKLLTDLLRPSVINAFVEAMKTTGGIAFTLRADGQPPRRKRRVLTNATINQPLKLVRALLFLAHAELVIPTPPKIDLLPQDDSKPVLPPTEAQFTKLLKLCADYRQVAPFMPEVVEFTAETGLRRGEVFNLTWGSVDLDRGAIRVEMQSRGRLVNGQAWRPKHNKWREVPLSARARAIVEQLRGSVPTGAEDLVFPSRSGAPYLRLDQTTEASGKGFFFDVVEAAGLQGKVTFHGLRHLFAVRLLTRGVPITVVSELLGHSDINLTVKRYGRFSSDAKIKFDSIRVLDVAEAGPAPIEPPRTLIALEGGARRVRSAG